MIQTLQRGIRRVATKASSSVLAGTAPHHNLYVFLHSHQSPESFPPVISSPLQKALQLKLAPLRGLVNFSWTLDQQPNQRTFDEETYSATVFSTYGRSLKIDQSSLSNLDQVVEQISQPTTVEQDSMRHIYVCTHAARDCRCGIIGSQVSDALRMEIDRRGLSSVIRLAETGHVGGHKYAANVLVYPPGEWLGNVTVEDVPSILDNILQQSRDWGLSTTPPLYPTHWRGRMGLDKDQQLELHSRRWDSCSG